jgi:DtxR family Mn-dependent transcriptional regulator
MNTLAEENYLKALYHLTTQSSGITNTNDIAAYVNTKASSVTDMLKKLAEKKLVNYKKYQGVSLSKKGTQKALQVIRKHRLWEYFLVEKLNFKWDEVHDIAEQLEHIQSDELTNRIENFLGFPKYDPHGDPIPDADGNIEELSSLTLSELKTGEKAIIVGVNNTSSSFLKHIENQKLTLGVTLKVDEVFNFDNSLKILINSDKNEIMVSHLVCKNILVKKVK